MCLTVTVVEKERNCPVLFDGFLMGRKSRKESKEQTCCLDQLFHTTFQYAGYHQKDKYVLRGIIHLNWGLDVVSSDL